MEQTSTEPLLLYPCPGCNSQLHFNARSQALVCEHCGTRVSVGKANDQLRENSMQQLLTDGANPALTVEQLVYKCNRCGSSSAFTTETATFVCAFCNFEIVNPVAYKTRIVQPAGLIPFMIDQPQSITIFKNWLGKGWWAPGDLLTTARQDRLRGVYMPFWTYDVQTSSDWTGYGGRYYYETEYYTEQGQRKSRQVQKTEWIYRTGSHEQFFNDILVGGATQLPEDQYEGIFPYRLEELVNFDYQYLSGWKAEVYNIDIADGYEKAKSIMAEWIHDACADACRIDTYRGLSIETNYSQQTYKHILLPVWICSYIYKNQHYFFLINGQTGSIYGKKPRSLMKMILVAVLVLVVIFALLYLFSNSG